MSKLGIHFFLLEKEKEWLSQKFTIAGRSQRIENQDYSFSIQIV